MKGGVYRMLTNESEHVTVQKGTALPGKKGKCGNS